MSFQDVSVAIWRRLFDDEIVFVKKKKNATVGYFQYLKKSVLQKCSSFNRKIKRYSYCS